mgnify:FL=1
MKGKFEFTQADMTELLDWLMEVEDLVDFNHEEHAVGTDIAIDQMNTDREVSQNVLHPKILFLLKSYRMLALKIRSMKH